MHPADMIFFWARSNPDQAALLQSDMAVTYRELAEGIETVCERIARYDFSRKEPVAVSIAHPIHKLVVCLALWRSGISFVPVGPRTFPYLRSSGINNLIFTGEGLMLSGGRNIRFEESWLRREAGASTPRRPASESLAGDTDAVFFGQGATGALEKTVVPSSALMARIKMLPFIGETNYATALILSSLNSPLGFCRVAVSLYAGKTACLAVGHEARLLAATAFNIDTLIGSAPQLADLADFIEKKTTGYPVDTLREVWIEDGRASKELVARIQAHLCRKVVAGYGSVEAGRIALASYDAIAPVAGAVGFVLPDVRVAIVDDAGAALPPGQDGWVRCRSEYYSRMFAANHPDRAGEAPDAWWHSGDRGRLTDEGMLCLHGIAPPN
jgi:acyl-coenzyme A synthetase/AMP-(fatty) acid ligase